MVFTHIPSNILLILLAFAPTVEIAIELTSKFLKINIQKDIN